MSELLNETTEFTETVTANGAMKPAVDETLYALTIIPQNAMKGSDFKAVPSNFSADEASIQWTLNGVPVFDANGYLFRADDAEKGDEVQAVASVGASKVLSNIVVILNSPPVINSIRLLPETFKPGERLHAEVEASDPDGDDIFLTFEWTKNGESAGRGPELDSDLQKGDRVVLTITPSDAEDAGDPLTVHRNIYNMPTTIIENNEFTFDGEIFSHQVRGFDPDGDELTYSLESDIEGVTIDPATGLITWAVPEDYEGEARMMVTVTDGFGGQAMQELSFNISGPQEASPVDEESLEEE